MKLWLVKVGKSDACIRPLFTNSVTYTVYGGKFGVGKIWSGKNWRTENHLPIFYLPIISFLQSVVAMHAAYLPIFYPQISSD